ncbi:MAG: hypothetical protein KKF30_10055 [Proteobacteria bacterium]|nr:hypothetical protein [Pseudomonadota bacterium]MBU4468884.1 hypothetical protein [Pseudomonadota bacterium]
MKRMALIFALNLYCLVLGVSAFAIEPAIYEDKDSGQNHILTALSQVESEAQSTFEVYGEKADSFQTAVSQSLSASADWLDSFFREDRIEIEENKTSLRLAFSSYFEEDNTYDLGIRARFKLILPGFEEKLHLFLTSDLDEAAVDPLALKGVVDKGDEQDLNLSLRYFFRNARKRNFSFRVGMRFNDLTPVFYGGPRYSLYKKMDPWMFRFTEKVSCYSDYGWRSRSDFAFERYLAGRFFFRTNFSGTWFQSDHGFFYSMNNSLYQTVDEDRAFVYEISTNFQTYPCNELSSLVMGIKCRTRIWREWLFFEVTPQLSFQNQYDFDPITGITFAIEGIFGKDALISAKP